MSSDLSIRELYGVTEEIFLQYKNKTFATYMVNPDDKAKLTACISGAITELTAVLGQISEV